MYDLVFGLSLIASSILGAIVFFSIFRRRKGSKASTWLMLAAASAVVWSGIYAPRFLLPVEHITAIQFFDIFIYVPVMLCSWSMFLFIYKTLENKTLPKAMLTTILILAAANAIAVITNPYTHIVLIPGEIVEHQDGFREVRDSYGLWFLFHCAFAYIPGLASIYFILKHLVKLKGRHKVMVVFLLFGLFLTIASTLVSVFDVLPWPVDTSPHTVQIALFLFYYSVFHIKSLSTVTVARIGLFENSDSMLFIIDEDGNIADLNNKAKKLAGQLGLNEPEGMRVEDFISRWHETSGGSYYESDQDIFTVNENGGETHYQMSRFFISDNLERREGYYVEIKNIENIMSLTRLLNEANEANRAKSEFLSRMSHEIRTPMNVIIGMTQIGLSATGDTGKMEYCFNNIERASKHLMSLINNVLELSKIEANKLEPVYEALDLNQMFDDVYSVMIIQANDKKQTLEIDVDPDVPRYIIFDKLNLSQVLINIISNAVKFTHGHGEIKVRAELAGQTGDKECLIKISVRDNGIGISAEQQEKIFASFEQADNTMSRQFGGTGLGLAISKKIIELMGGSLDVSSTPGEGSCFTVTIKAERCDKEYYEKKNCPAAAPETYGNCRLLLAEDIAINREIVMALLADSKIMVDCAENGLQAVEMFKENPDMYDVILMDVQMPVMDGLEATKQIRNSGVRAAESIPIIALTANAFKEDAEECIRAGMNGHIGKPVEASVMSGMLSKYLHGKADKT